MTIVAADGRATRLLGIIALGGLTLAALYLGRLPGALLAVEQTFLAVVPAVVVALACFACGSLAVRAFTGWSRNPAATVPVDESFLIGLGAFGTITGAVAWITVRPLPALTSVLAVIGLVLLIRRRGAPLPAVNAATALVLAPAIMLALVQAITPIASADELIYKLAVPHAYELYGRMVELPLNSNSYLAMSVHLADLAALMLGSAISAKALHFLAFLAALATLWRLASRLPGRSGLWTTVAIAYTPALMFVAGWAFSEWCLLGLLVLSFSRYERWLESSDDVDLVIAAAASGAAISIKYTALPWMLPFVALVIWRHRREVRSLARAAVVLLLMGGFFYVRNAVWTGSPFAPMFLPDAPQVQNYRSGYALSGWVELLRGTDVADPEIGDEALGILLPLCALAGLVALRNRDRATRDLAVIGVMQMAILLTIAPGSRNMINGVAALAIPGASLIALTWQRSAPWLRGVAVTGVFLAVAIQSVLPIHTIEAGIPYLTGSESLAEHVQRTRRYSAAYAWVDRTAPDSKVLLIGETRTLHMPRRFGSGGNLDGPRVARWLSSFPTAPAMAGAFRSEGYTHLLLHPAWYRSTADPAPPLTVLESEFGVAVTPATHAVLTEVVRNHATLRYRDSEYLIFELNR